MSLSVRPAAVDDVPALLDMMVDFNRIEHIVFDPQAARPNLERLVSGGELGLVLVAEAAGATVGYAVVTYGFDLEFGGRDAFMTELYLRPDARGRRLGAPLLAAVEQAARAHGVRALHLVVRHENEPARALYARAGFRDIPRQLMTKHLA